MAGTVKPGDKAICMMCDEIIRYVGPHWEHLGELQPRHPAWPKALEPQWIDNSMFWGKTHLYVLIEYSNFPYTLIISEKMTTLIAGHAVSMPGVIVALDLFSIFGEETPDALEEFKQKAHSLAIRFLSIAFNHSHELRGK
jgi:hypothetical protein